MSLIISATLQRSDHDTKIAREIASLYDVQNKKCRLTDVQLNVGNKTFHCHKLILQLYSEFFANQSLSTTGKLSIDPEPFSDVLQFMYTGKVQVSSSSVESLLATAETLRVSELKQLCLNFLNDYLTSDDVLAYWRLAKKYEQPELAVKCRTLVLNEFAKFNCAKKLKEISEDMMEELLRSDNLNVENESIACDILVNWIEAHSEAGNQIHRDRLLLFIRWSGITIDYVKTKLVRNHILKYDPACVKQLQRIMGYLESQSGPFEGFRTSHRPSTRLENCLITVGNDYDYSRTTSDAAVVSRVSLQRNGKDSVTVIESLPLRINNESAIWAFNANTLYVIGAGGRSAPYNEVWKLDTTSGWTRCADMDVGRQAHCVVALDSYIYVLGGWDADNKILGNISRYNTKKDAWSPSGDLKRAVDSAACVKYKNTIYMFGGEDENLEALNVVQAYTPGQIMTSTFCRLLDKPMPRACAELRAIMWETSAILLCCETCLIYNFDTKTWQERALYGTNVHGFAAALDNMTVFIAGGGKLGGGGGKLEEKSRKSERGGGKLMGECDCLEEQCAKREGENSNLKREEDGDDDGYEPKWTCTDSVKSVSVLDIIHNRPVEWKQHANLVRPSVTGAHLLIALPLSRQLSDTFATLSHG